MKEFNLERLLQAFNLRLYEAKISEAYSHKFAAFFQLICDSCPYSNNWIAQLIESI